MNINLVAEIILTFLSHLVIDDGLMLATIVGTFIPRVLSFLLMTSVNNLLRMLPFVGLEVDLFSFGVYVVVRNQLSDNFAHVFFVSKAF